MRTLQQATNEAQTEIDLMLDFIEQSKSERMEYLYNSMVIYVKTNNIRHLSINVVYSQIDNLIHIEDADSGAEIIYCTPSEWTELKNKMSGGLSQ